MAAATPARIRIGLAASGWVALAAIALPAGSVPRGALTFAFVFFCPGAAAVRLAQAVFLRVGARAMDALEAFVVAVGVSLALGALVSEAFFLAQSFSTTGVVVVLAVLTSVAALIPVRGRRFSPREPG